jgi:hypothetical protein
LICRFSLADQRFTCAACSELGSAGACNSHVIQQWGAV